jgi:hypothetical protein
MNTISFGKVRASVVMRVAVLFIFAIAGIAFFASPIVSFASSVGCTKTATYCVTNANKITTIKEYPATFVAAFTVMPGTTGAPTLTPDSKFKLTDDAPTTGTEIIQAELNNQTVFALFQGHSEAMTAQNIHLTLIASSNKTPSNTSSGKAHVGPPLDRVNVL